MRNRFGANASRSGSAPQRFDLDDSTLLPSYWRELYELWLRRESRRPPSGLLRTNGGMGYLVPTLSHRSWAPRRRRIALVSGYHKLGLSNKPSLPAIPFAGFQGCARTRRDNPVGANPTLADWQSVRYRVLASDHAGDGRTKRRTGSQQAVTQVNRSSFENQSRCRPAPEPGRPYACASPGFNQPTPCRTETCRSPRGWHADKRNIDATWEISWFPCPVRVAVSESKGKPELGRRAMRSRSRP